MSGPKVCPLNPCRMSEADEKLAAAVFERLARALSTVAITTTRREHMRRITRNSTSRKRFEGA